MNPLAMMSEPVHNGQGSVWSHTPYRVHAHSSRH